MRSELIWAGVAVFTAYVSSTKITSSVKERQEGYYHYDEKSYTYYNGDYDTQYTAMFGVTRTGEGVYYSKYTGAYANPVTGEYGDYYGKDEEITYTTNPETSYDPWLGKYYNVDYGWQTIKDGENGINIDIEQSFRYGYYWDKVTDKYYSGWYQDSYDPENGLKYYSKYGLKEWDDGSSVNEYYGEYYSAKENQYYHGHGWNFMKIYDGHFREIYDPWLGIYKNSPHSYMKGKTGKNQVPQDWELNEKYNYWKDFQTGNTYNADTGQYYDSDTGNTYNGYTEFYLKW